MGVWTAVGLCLVYALLARDRLEINVLHDRNPQFVMESDGSIRNGYTIRLLNMIPEPRTVMLSLDGVPEATMKIIGVSDLPGRTFAIEVQPDRATALKVYVTLPPEAAKGETSFHFLAEDRSSHESDSYSANFFTPGGNR
jgi:polyferredoxin